MPRKRYTSYMITWTFSKKDPVAVANARVLLALVRLVRSTRGCLKDRNEHQEAMTALLPVLLRMKSKALKVVRDWRADDHKNLDKQLQEAELERSIAEIGGDEMPDDVLPSTEPESLLDFGNLGALGH